MKILFRATGDFMAAVRRDLSRRHPFAHERVGFITARAAQGHDHLVVLAEDYHPVADNDYVPDPSVGAMIGQEALRKALELALLKPVGVFHVHLHGLPAGRRLWFSPIDLREQVKFVPDFFKVRRNMPHGAIVLSPYSAAGRVWLRPDEIVNFSEFVEVDAQVSIRKSSQDGSTDFYA
ncbi:hypothetical protein GWG65_13925 [Bradyrhizobium sp. CSA207]|uniref:hypothetical protein n=1 Tax=Bradyrhizobium sp. CSA207 TaxID=2698826 RepID=UPI0023AF2CE6|nr:hypothetical protein [Bradyrhizobium sp. CSA207]MDE5442527.1 hypothetical protein [Bradyrhizobium sp. CSA207]